jgi:hypothetical protein
MASCSRTSIALIRNSIKYQNRVNRVRRPGAREANQRSPEASQVTSSPSAGDNQTRIKSVRNFRIRSHGNRRLNKRDNRRLNKRDNQHGTASKGRRSPLIDPRSEPMSFAANPFRKSIRFSCGLHTFFKHAAQPQNEKPSTTQGSSEAEARQRHRAAAICCKLIELDRLNTT